ncbi:MAG: hypothetical protein HY904_19585 [Deltaproteobacteria bacterium]|nr:hypothetical protein [Deltaproteobacteria bacterium]
MPPRDPKLPDNPFAPREVNPVAPSKPHGAKFNRLNALFDKGGGGGPPPPGPRGLGPSGGAMESRMRMERLRGAVDPAELDQACDALLRHHQMPDEPELLCKMLRHSDAGVGERALAELGALHARGKLNRTMTVRDALEAFRSRCREPNAISLLEKLLAP